MKTFISRWIMRLFSRRHDKTPDGRSQHPMAPMLDCESVMRQLWDYLDGELTPERTTEIRMHVEVCQRCYPQFQFERSFLDAISERRHTHSDPERLRAMLHAALLAKGLSDA